ncbi:hypothetical protein ACRAWF_06590 [Streptomyces sp. L7]
MDTLTTLAATTPRMFVATSKPAVATPLRIVEHFGLKPYFERVFGSRTRWHARRQARPAALRARRGQCRSE